MSWGVAISEVKISKHSVVQCYGYSGVTVTLQAEKVYRLKTWNRGRQIIRVKTSVVDEEQANKRGAWGEY